MEIYNESFIIEKEQLKILMKKIKDKELLNDNEIYIVFEYLLSHDQNMIINMISLKIIKNKKNQQEDSRKNKNEEQIILIKELI